VAREPEVSLGENFFSLISFQPKKWKINIGTIFFILISEKKLGKKAEILNNFYFRWGDI
jgi:hypothetical protein